MIRRLSILPDPNGTGSGPQALPCQPRPRLSRPGISPRETSPDGRLPLLYEYEYVDPAPLARMEGDSHPSRRRDPASDGRRRPVLHRRIRRRGPTRVRRPDRASSELTRRVDTELRPPGRSAIARMPTPSQPAATRLARSPGEGCPLTPSRLRSRATHRDPAYSAYLRKSIRPDRPGSAESRGFIRQDAESAKGSRGKHERICFPVFPWRSWRPGGSTSSLSSARRFDMDEDVADR